MKKNKMKLLIIIGAIVLIFVLIIVGIANLKISFSTGSVVILRNFSSLKALAFEFVFKFQLTLSTIYESSSNLAPISAHCSKSSSSLTLYSSAKADNSATF